jgi:hypothetical protein
VNGLIVRSLWDPENLLVACWHCHTLLMVEFFVIQQTEHKGQRLKVGKYAVVKKEVFLKRLPAIRAGRDIGWAVRVLTCSDRDVMSSLYSNK